MKLFVNWFFRYLSGTFRERGSTLRYWFIDSTIIIINLFCQLFSYSLSNATCWIKYSAGHQQFRSVEKYTTFDGLSVTGDFNCRSKYAKGYPQILVNNEITDARKVCKWKTTVLGANLHTFLSFVISLFTRICGNPLAYFDLQFKSPVTETRQRSNISLHFKTADVQHYIKSNTSRSTKSS